MQIFNPMRYSKLSLARHEQVERPRPFAPRLRLLRSSESSGDSQQTHHHRASPGRVLGFSSPPVSALWCWHSTSSVRHRSGSPARKPASAAFPPVAWPFDQSFANARTTGARSKNLSRPTSSTSLPTRSSRSASRSTSRSPARSSFGSFSSAAQSLDSHRFGVNPCCRTETFVSTRCIQVSGSAVDQLRVGAPATRATSSGISATRGSTSPPSPRPS